MERLTMNRGICQMVSTEYCQSHRDCYECEHGRKVFRSLAAYEDTGLEPDEIPHWISCSEKLPKISDEYLVLTENGDIFNANFDKDCGDNGEFGEWQDRYDEHTLGFLDSEWSSYGGITHWSPLPQPPKEKNNG